ncbi:MAG: sigma-70 family RNA polymerase sigma factor [Gemmataceae bacterium]
MTTRTFEEALQAALPVVYQRLTRRYGDEQLAEEVSWDCLTQAYEVWREDPDYFANRDLTRWTSNRANWRALDVLRKRSRLASLAEERGDDGETFPTLIDPRDAEEERRLQRDREAVFASVQQLDERDRFIVESYYYDGLTDQEIGRHLFGEEGSEQARGLRVGAAGRRGHAQLHALVVQAGVDAADYSSAPHQAV